MATARRRASTGTKTNPARMSKADLLEAIGRKLSKAELASLNTALQHGFRPYAPTPEELAVGATPGWTAPGTPAS